MYLTATEYWLLMKPRIMLAMVALYSASYLGSCASIGGFPFDTSRFFIGFLSVFTAVGGSNVINCYLDRDIDALMARTRRRPLPKGNIRPNRALVFSLILLVPASALSLSFGATSFLLITVVGAGTYIIIYTLFTKRRTSLNVLTVAPSVAAPAWFGWLIGGAPFNLEAFALGLLIAIWGPLHLWSIAYSFSNDYRLCGVPMLPTVISSRKAVHSITTALVALISFSYLLSLSRSMIYTIVVTLVNIPLILAGVRFYKEPSNIASWKLFKITAPYIILVLIVFTIDKYVSA
jgi:protoheme IX farnesyltransferase